MKILSTHQYQSPTRDCLLLKLHIYTPSPACFSNEQEPSPPSECENNPIIIFVSLYHLLLYDVLPCSSARRKHSRSRNKYIQIDPICWLTLLRPLGECRLFAVKNRVLVLVTLLPFVALVSNYHPPGITGTAPIVPVDEEVPVVVWLSRNGKVLLWLCFYICRGHRSLSSFGKAFPWVTMIFLTWCRVKSFYCAFSCNSIPQWTWCENKVVYWKLAHY